MSFFHTVKQGECLSLIAAQYGFTWKSLCNHSDNIKFKDNPNLIYPGDKVAIPDKTTKKESIPSECKNTFKIESIPFTLKLRFLHNGKPVGGEPYSYTPVAKYVVPIEGRTTSEGKTEIQDTFLYNDYFNTMRIISIGDPVRFYLGLQIAFLNPIDTVSGIKSRLRNLGFNPGSVEDENITPLFINSIKKFQAFYKLKIDGNWESEKVKEMLLGLQKWDTNTTAYQNKDFSFFEMNEINCNPNYSVALSDGDMSFHNVINLPTIYPLIDSHCHTFGKSLLDRNMWGSLLHGLATISSGLTWHIYPFVFEGKINWASNFTSSEYDNSKKLLEHTEKCNNTRSPVIMPLPIDFGFVPLNIIGITKLLASLGNNAGRSRIDHNSYLKFYYKEGEYILFDSKIQTLTALNRAISETTLKSPGQILPFLPFEPRRPYELSDDAKSASDSPTGNIDTDVHKYIKEARKKGFVGIKLYSRLGWMPTGNRKLYSDFIADQIDKRLEVLYKYCIAEDFPITVHTSPGGFPQDGQLVFPKSFYEGYKGDDELAKVFMGKLNDSSLRVDSTISDFCMEGLRQAAAFCYYIQYTTSPYAWEEVLTKYKNLRICFAHSGSDQSIFLHYIDKIIGDQDLKEIGDKTLKDVTIDVFASILNLLSGGNSNDNNFEIVNEYLVEKKFLSIINELKKFPMVSGSSHFKELFASSAALNTKKLVQAQIENIDGKIEEIDKKINALQKRYNDASNGEANRNLIDEYGRITIGVKPFQEHDNSRLSELNARLDDYKDQKNEYEIQRIKLLECAKKIEAEIEKIINDAKENWSKWIKNWTTKYKINWFCKIIQLTTDYKNVYCDSGCWSGGNTLNRPVLQKIIEVLSTQARSEMDDKVAKAYGINQIPSTEKSKLNKKILIGTDWFMLDQSKISIEEFWQNIRNGLHRSLKIMTDNDDNDTYDPEQDPLWLNWTTKNTLDFLKLDKSFGHLEEFYSSNHDNISELLPSWWKNVKEYYGKKEV